MAIKGKRKPKSRGRAVATPPRPFLVPPKTPLFRRTGTKVVVVILLEAIVFGVVLLAGAQSEEDRRRREINEFTSLVEAALYSSGAAQPLPTGPLVLPELGQAIAQLEAGEAKEQDVTQSAQSWSDLTEGAADTIGQIEAESLALKEARNLMEQGLRVYSGVAGDVAVVFDLDGEIQRGFVESIGQEYQVAAQIFDTGFGKLQEERRKAELPTSSGLPGPLDPGLPPGIPGVPGG
jgi:hypothetical protein